MKYMIVQQTYEYIGTYDTEEKAEEVLDQLGRDHMASFGECSPYYIEEITDE
jgi:hypothetical protein